MSSRRPRRSRIYDSNYNIGENYYRSAVDRLDENSRSKPSLSRFSEPPPQVSPPPRNRFETSAAELEDELEVSRDRASKAIQRETVFDRPSRKLELDQIDFDEQVSEQNTFKILTLLCLFYIVNILHKFNINIKKRKEEKKKYISFSRLVT